MGSLFGGGSSVQAPNPEVTIPLQQAADQQSFDHALNAQRVNQVSPYGSQTWESTPRFDQAGFTAAQTAWQNGGTPSPGAPATAGHWTDGGGSGDQPGAPVWVPGTPATPGGTTRPGAAPTRADFTTDQWTYRQTLSPEQQQIFDANQSAQLGQAETLGTLTGRVQDSVSQPLNWNSAPSLTGSVDAANIRGYGGSQPALRGVAQQDLNSYTGQQANLTAPNNAAINAGDLPTEGGNADDYDMTQLRAMIRDRSGGFSSGLASISDEIAGMNPLAFNQEAANAQYQAATRYMDPEIANQQQALEARLAEQGFVPGTPGYAKAMEGFQDTTNRARADARDRSTLLGANVGRDAFSSGLAGAQTRLGALTTGANFGLSNDQARSGEQLNNANFGLTQDNADFGRRQDVAELLQSLQGQDFNQQVTASGIERQRDLDANSVSQQLYGNRLNTLDFNNDITQGNFDNDVRERTFDNSVAQQGYENRLNTLNFNNAAERQQQEADTGAGAFGNTARSQSIAELLAQRNQPLNELNAMRTGTQVNLPNNPAQYGVPNMGTPNVTGAYNDLFQGQVGSENAQIAGQNNTLSSIATMAAMYF